MGAAQGAALSAPLDTGLQTVIDGWKTLPDAIRAGIVAMVKASTVTQNPSIASRCQRYDPPTPGTAVGVEGCGNNM